MLVTNANCCTKESLSGKIMYIIVSTWTTNGATRRISTSFMWAAALQCAAVGPDCEDLCATDLQNLHSLDPC